MIQSIINTNNPDLFNFFNVFLKIKDLNSFLKFKEEISLFINENDIIYSENPDIRENILHIVTDKAEYNTRFIFKYDHDNKTKELSTSVHFGVKSKLGTKIIIFNIEDALFLKLNKRLIEGFKNSESFCNYVKEKEYDFLYTNSFISEILQKSEETEGYLKSEGDNNIFFITNNDFTLHISFDDDFEEFVVNMQDSLSKSYTETFSVLDKNHVFKEIQDRYDLNYKL
jgi:hypothetical protein